MTKPLAAVYGLSAETEKHLPDIVEKYEVIGLLDSYRSEGNMYGLPIVSLEAVVVRKISVIIVVARPASCRAIVGKIGEICCKKNIAVIDCDGKSLLDRQNPVFVYEKIAKYTENEFEEICNGADIISFDLFGTLVTRTVLCERDLFELVDLALKRNKINILDFVELREAIEKKLSIDGIPSLVEIYDCLLASANIEGITGEYLAAIEFDTDKKTIVPRKVMTEYVERIKKSGKKICITTDSYYNFDQVNEILKCNDIVDVDGLFVSSEYRTDKRRGLFREVKKFFESVNIVHIGDDKASDIAGGRNEGIKTFYVYNPTELYYCLGELGLSESIMTLMDRVKIGFLVANLFNNPFCINSTDERVCVGNPENIGKIFCAPVILDFIKWYGDRIQEYGITDSLFGARDGYIFSKLYPLVYQDVSSHYFYTSRIAAIRAGITNEEDIEYVDRMKFSGPLISNLRVRFGIDISECLCDENKSNLDISRYRQLIFEKSKAIRENYLSYINAIKIKGERIAFFDFVAQGTCQKFIQKLFANKLVGLYFMQLCPKMAEMNSLFIDSFYKVDEALSSNIYRDYYLLEVVLTSPEPSVDEFDIYGNPVFASETRTAESIDYVLKIQKGISEYISEALQLIRIDECIINKELDEKILALIHSIEIVDGEFMKLIVEDPFFNRNTSVSDLI